jgi:hypothetical protein
MHSTTKLYLFTLALRFKSPCPLIKQAAPQADQQCHAHRHVPKLATCKEACVVSFHPTAQAFHTSSKLCEHTSSHQGSQQRWKLLLLLLLRLL